MSMYNTNSNGAKESDGWGSWENDNSDDWFHQDQSSSQRQNVTTQQHYNQVPPSIHQQQHGNQSWINPQSLTTPNYESQGFSSSYNNYGNENATGGQAQLCNYMQQPATQTPQMFDPRQEHVRGFDQQVPQEQKSELSQPVNTGYPKNIPDQVVNQFHHQPMAHNQEQHLPSTRGSNEFQQSVSSSQHDLQDPKQSYSEHYLHHQQQNQHFLPQYIVNTQFQPLTEFNQNQQKEQNLTETKNYCDSNDLQKEQVSNQPNFSENCDHQAPSSNTNLVEDQPVQKHGEATSYSDNFAQNMDQPDVKPGSESSDFQREVMTAPNSNLSDIQANFEKLQIGDSHENMQPTSVQNQLEPVESAEKVAVDTLLKPTYHTHLIDTANSSQVHSRQSSFGGANFIVGDPDQSSQTSDPPSNKVSHLSLAPESENQGQTDPTESKQPLDVPMIRSDIQVSNKITSHPDSPFKPPKTRNPEGQESAQIRETQPPLKTENFTLFTPKNTPDFSPIVPNPLPTKEPDTPVARPKSVTDTIRPTDPQNREDLARKSENNQPDKQEMERLDAKDDRQFENERRDYDRDKSNYENRDHQTRYQPESREQGPQYSSENRDFDNRPPSDHREYDGRQQVENRDYNRYPNDRRDDRRNYDGRSLNARDPPYNRDDRRDHDGRQTFDERDSFNRRDQYNRRNVEDDRASEPREPRDNKSYSNMDRMFYNEGDRSKRYRERDRNEEDNRSRQDYEKDEDSRRRARDPYYDAYSRRRPDDPRYHSFDQSDYNRGYRNETRGRERSRRGDAYEYSLSREPSYDRSYTRHREPSFDRSSNYGRPPSRGSAYAEDRPPSRQGYHYRDYYGYSQDYPRDYGTRFDRGYAEEMRSYGEKLQEYENNYKMWANFCKQYGQGQAPYQQPGIHSRGSTPAVGGTAADNFANTGQGSRPNSRMGQMMYPQQYPGMDMAYMYYNNPAAYYQMGYQAEVRKTPLKYNLPHARASFGPGGQLIKVHPNNPKEGQRAYVDLLKFTVECDVEELKRFPGPLVRGDTHKNDVLRFCQEEATLCRQDDYAVDRESILLLWNLLQFLIKQNGTVIGSDLAYLLLEGHEPTSADFSRTGVKTETTMNSSSAIDSSSINNLEKDSTDRFRHLLLFGRKKDALDWACKNGLWGHALFLASKMDSKTHAAIMTKFANIAMKMNDPLQTLYQLMSGRQPAAVTLVSDEKWGDWRPHLAMILANESRDRPDLDAKSICVLGDTLAAKGCLHASHICYLTAKIHPGQYGQPNSKYVLLGSSHYRSFEGFANNLAIQCTEVYEYAKSLAGIDQELSALTIRLLPYKFLYATRLYTAGMLEEAFQYCEILAKTIVQYQGYFCYAIIVGVHKLANQLKFHTCEKGLYYNRDDGDPDWLVKLSQLVGVSSLQNPCYDVDSVSQSGGNEQPQSGYNQLYPVQEPMREEGITEGEPDQPMQNSMNDFDGGYHTYHQTAQYDSSNAGQSALGGQIGLAQDTIDPTQGQPTQTSNITGYIPQVNNIVSGRGAIATSNDHLDLAASLSSAGGGTDISELDRGIDAERKQVEDRFNLGSSTSALKQLKTISPPLSPRSQTSSQASPPSSNHSVFSYKTTNRNIADIPPPPPQTVTRTRNFSHSSHASLPPEQPPFQEPVMPPRQQQTSQPPKDASKVPNSNTATPSQGRGGGWFSNLIKSVIPTGANEMNLPDDNDPEIRWCENSKCYVDRNGKPIGNVAENLPPPPTAAEAPICPPMPGLGANISTRNSMRKYVDVLADQKLGADSPDMSLLKVDPKTAKPSNLQIFNPMGYRPNPTEENTFQNDQAPEPEGAPTQAQTAPPAAVPTSYPASGSTDNQENQFNQGVPTIYNPGQGAPTMFDPSQFSAPAQMQLPPTGGLSRLSQKRVYPS